ncbi:zinc-dependent alcohol dehydrogenase family protein [Aspergillus ruber CBS 135680]|uniref:Putative zinc-binding oxidoreductase n=1 Tax=Aspergillus ruber (strain CBS 135680) TaxID=1388766 RepID=A0A017S5U9_ASPRC|nr:putative zinc-binding oxidoreductase [Aspergillus ruber CBS 135680]EYE91999.1 putative zinc-binding oxidoreductase [Aspergillus ruber CBS 135680]
MATMKALVYTAPSTIELQTRPKPTIKAPTDAIIRIQHASICGTDLHILKGDVPSIQPERILGHEGVGTVEEIGASVSKFAVGDRVLIASQTCCGGCRFCQRGIVSHCDEGGWQLGNRVDGTQAEYVRIPHANLSLHKIPDGIPGRIAIMLSDVLPTGMECGTLNGNVSPGGSVVIIGAGPIGVGCLLTAQLYSPATLVMVDVDEARLEQARAMGAQTVNTRAPDAKETLDRLTDGQGFDSVIEAVGIPATFEQAQELVAVGGSIANVGVHGVKVDLHIEKLWDRNISINMALVNATSIPRLMRLVQSGMLDVSSLVTHSFPMAQADQAYSTFQAAAQHRALKVTIDIE